MKHNRFVGACEKKSPSPFVRETRGTSASNPVAKSEAKSKGETKAKRSAESEAKRAGSEMKAIGSKANAQSWKSAGAGEEPVFKAGSRVAVLNSSPSTMFYQIYEVAIGYENGFACVRSVERPLGPVAEIDVGRYGWIYLDTNPTLAPGRTIQLYWARNAVELRRNRVEGEDSANCSRIRGALRRHLEPADLLRAIPPPLPKTIVPPPAASRPLVLPPPRPVRLPP